VDPALPAVADSAVQLHRLADWPGTRRRRSRCHPLIGIAEQPGQATPTESEGQLAAGRQQPERQAPQRLAVTRQHGQGSLVAEPDRAVQLVRSPEDDPGRLDRRQPQGKRITESIFVAFLNAPERMLGKHLKAAALDLRVGELEPHCLEGGERLAELLTRLRRPVNAVACTRSQGPVIIGPAPA